MKRLRVVLDSKDLERLHDRQPLIVRTPNGEQLEIALSLTVSRPARHSSISDMIDDMARDIRRGIFTP